MFRSKKCPLCKSKEISEVKPSTYRKMQDQFFIAFRKATKTLNICRDCKFQWEDR